MIIEKKRKNRKESKAAQALQVRRDEAKGQIDFVLLITTCALIIFGVLMVFSASYYWSIDKVGTPYNFLIKDLFWVATGAVIMFLTAKIDYHAYRYFAYPLLFVGLVLLVLVLVPGVGENINGATRWIPVVGGFTIMPGEVIKICVILAVATYFYNDPRKVNRLFKGVFAGLLLTGICVALIMQQPNMSTAITVAAIIVGMMYIAGLHGVYFFMLAGMGFVGALYLIFEGGGYRLRRFTSFLDPFADPLGDGYQVCQGLMAMGSGGLTGVGIGKSVQKNLYLPEPQNDFILAIIGEELGYLAVLLLMLVYIFLVWRCVKVIMRAPDRYGALLGSGITIMIAIQVVLNVAVVTSTMPPTGVTLPFISYGGNALWLFMGSMGILLNISKQAAIPKKKREEAVPGERQEPLYNKSNRRHYEKLGVQQ